MRADVKPADLLDVQSSLREWWATETGARFARGWDKATMDKRGAGVVTEEHLERTQVAILGQAETYWVSKEMTAVTQKAAESMPPQMLRADDLPAEHGFIWFDRPLYVRDIHGQRCGLRALVWATRIIHVVRHDWTSGDPLEEVLAASTEGPGHGISLTWYSDIEDQDDEVNAQMIAEGVDWERYRRESHRLSVFHLDAWPFGTTFRQDIRPWDDVLATDEDESVVVDTRRFFAAFLTLQSQRLAHVERQQAARASRRRLERSGTLDASKEIRVVTLRRYREASDEERAEIDHQGIEWSHRWMVSGHWRNQWVPSMNDHRLTWIDPYVKGPEDRPLLLRDTVFKLTR